MRTKTEEKRIERLERYIVKLEERLEGLSIFYNNHLERLHKKETHKK